MERSLVVLSLVLGSMACGGQALEDAASPISKSAASFEFAGRYGVMVGSLDDAHVLMAGADGLAMDGAAIEGLEFLGDDLAGATALAFDANQAVIAAAGDGRVYVLEGTNFEYSAVEKIAVEPGMGASVAQKLGKIVLGGNDAVEVRAGADLGYAPTLSVQGPSGSGFGASLVPIGLGGGLLTGAPAANEVHFFNSEAGFSDFFTGPTGGEDFGRLSAARARTCTFTFGNSSVDARVDPFAFAGSDRVEIHSMGPVEGPHFVLPLDPGAPATALAMRSVGGGVEVAVGIAAVGAVQIVRCKVPSTNVNAQPYVVSCTPLHHIVAEDDAEGFGAMVAFEGDRLWIGAASGSGAETRFYRSDL